MPCFKFPRCKWKKRSKKQDKRLENVTDTTTSITLDEIRLQHDSNAGSTISNPEKVLNCTTAADSSVNVKTGCPQNAKNEKQNDNISTQSEENTDMTENDDNCVIDSYQDDKSSDFQNCIDKNKETSISVQCHLERPEDAIEVIRPLSNRTDSISDPEIMTDYKKIQAVNNEITNCTATVTEVIEYSNVNEYLQNLYIKKTYEIISKITVSSNVFDEIEKLKALEAAGEKLHPELIHGKCEKRESDFHIGDTENDSRSFYKPSKIDSMHSKLTLDSEIHPDIDYMDTLSFSTKNKIMHTELINNNDLENEDDLYEISNLPNEIPHGQNENIIENTSIPSLKNCEAKISEIAENTNDEELKVESHNSDIYHEYDSECFEINPEGDENYDVGHDEIAEKSLDINENMLPTSETITEVNSEINGHKKESKNETKIETHKVEGITKNQKGVFTSSTYTLQNNDKCEILEESSYFINYKADIEDTTEDLDKIYKDNVSADRAEVLSQNETFSEITLQSECETFVSGEGNNFDTILKPSESQILLITDQKEQNNFIRCPSPKPVKEKLFPDDLNTTLKEAIKSDDSNKYGQTFVKPFAVTSSVDLNLSSTNEATRIFSQTHILKSCSDSFQDECSLTKMAHSNPKNLSDEQDLYSFSEAQRFYLERENLPHNNLEKIFASKGSFSEYICGDTLREIPPNSILKFDTNEAFICNVKNKSIPLPNGNEFYKLALETPKEEENILHENKSLEIFDEDKINQETKKEICSKVIDLEINHTSDSSAKCASSFDTKSYVLKSASSSSFELSFSVVNDLEELEKLSINTPKLNHKVNEGYETNAARNEIMDESFTKEILCIDNGSSEKSCLGHSNLSKESLEYPSKFSDCKKEVPSKPFLKFQNSFISIDNQRKVLPLTEENFGTFNGSAESLFADTEFSEDNSICKDESTDCKNDTEVSSLSEQSMEAISTHSSLDNIKSPKDYSYFKYLKSNCQRTSKQNENKRPTEYNSFRKEARKFLDKEKKITANLSSFRKKYNYTNFTTNSNKGKLIFPKQETKRKKEKLLNQICDHRSLMKGELQSKILENKLLLSKINNISLSSKLRKNTAHTVSKDNQKTIPATESNLSDSSYSSSSSKYFTNEYMKVQNIENGQDTDHFEVTGSGDSGTEEKKLPDVATLREIRKMLQNIKDSNTLQHNLFSRIKLSKAPRTQKIKICITKQISKKNKSTIKKVNSENTKQVSSLDKNSMKLNIGDNTTIVSCSDKNDSDRKLNKTNKNKQDEIINEIRYDDGLIEDDTEMICIESSKLFNKQRERILSKMGPKLRNIPIKKSDSIEVKCCEIEKICLNTNIDSPKKKDLSMKHSSDIRSLSRTVGENTSAIYEKIPHLKGKATQLGESIQDCMMTSSSKATENSEILNESDTGSQTGCSERMTPIRRTILNSSRSIRSPKYPFPITEKIIRKRDTYPFKPLFIKSTKRNIVAHIKGAEMNDVKYKDLCNTKSPYSQNFKIESPKKQQTATADNSKRQQHAQDYRTATPEDIKTKFDEVFKRYAGKGRSNGDLISYKRSTEWLRDAGIVGKMLSAEEATDAFKCTAGAKVALNKGDYRQFLQKLSRVKRLNYNEVYDKLCNAFCRFEIY